MNALLLAALVHLPNRSPVGRGRRPLGPSARGLEAVLPVEVVPLEHPDVEPGSVDVFVASKPAG